MGISGRGSGTDGYGIGGLHSGRLSRGPRVSLLGRPGSVGS
jgi:hypothetical protein